MGPPSLSGQSPPQPFAEHGVELLAGGPFEPGIVAAALKLPVLQLGQKGLENGPYHAPRVRVRGAVEHQDGHVDGPEGAGVYARFLEPEHVLPRLVVPQASAASAASSWSSATRS